MKKKTGKKLVLDQSTVRSLSEHNMKKVEGGVTGTCQPCSDRQSGCTGPAPMTGLG